VKGQGETGDAWTAGWYIAATEPSPGEGRAVCCCDFCRRMWTEPAVVAERRRDRSFSSGRLDHRAVNLDPVTGGGP
jgi:hypothetical protein